MPIYKIAIWEEQSGVFEVKAKNKREAEKIVEEVDQFGIDEIAKRYEFKIMHREVNLLNN